MEWFHRESNSSALHATFRWKQPLWEHCTAAVSKVTGHLAMWWGCSACVNVLWEWHHTDLLLITNEAQRGLMGAEQQCSLSPWGWKVEHISSVSDLVYHHCLQRCVKRFSLIHIGYRSDLDSLVMSAEHKVVTWLLGRPPPLCVSGSQYDASLLGMCTVHNSTSQITSLTHL